MFKANVTIYSKIRKVTKKRNLAHKMILECNFGQVLLLANVSKSTLKSTHGTRLCGRAQGLHIAIFLCACGLQQISEHILFLVTCILYLVLLYGDIPLMIF